MVFFGKNDSWCRLPISRAKMGWISSKLSPRLESRPRRRHSRLPKPTTCLQGCGQDKFWVPQSSSPRFSGVPQLHLELAKTAMQRSPKSTTGAASRAEPTQRQRPYPTLRLNPTMACDTAFRVVARRCLENLTANHPATCRGEPGALHQMRIALTRLRTAIVFFSPMVDDSERTRIKNELKWLNTRLGTVRDLDVAIERLKAVSRQRP